MQYIFKLPIKYKDVFMINNNLSETESTSGTWKWLNQKLK